LFFFIFHPFCQEEEKVHEPKKMYAYKSVPEVHHNVECFECGPLLIQVPTNEHGFAGSEF